jgi:hypothetical protein
MGDLKITPMETNSYPPNESSQEESSVSPETSWQKLLAQGVHLKTEILDSVDFRSPVEASTETGIDARVISKMIQDNTLFALENPTTGGSKIPVWALDDAIYGSVIQSILQGADTADPWHVYHFLTTPQGRLNGLRPFELLQDEQHIGAAQRLARDELLAYLKLTEPQELVDLVREALRADLNEKG